LKLSPATRDRRNANIHTGAHCAVREEMDGGV